MRSNTRIRLRLLTGVGVLTAFAGVLAIGRAGESQAEKPSGNSKCYVCHPGMKTEELTTNHLDMGVTCDACHGPSVEHMHDEMLMTKPDLLFGRSEVARMCSTCHKPGGEREVFRRQDHKDPAAVEAFFQKWTGRMRPNGRAVNVDSVCTDCHGTHNITKPINTQSGDGQPAEWLAAFNGRDLAGWQPSGSAAWTVEAGRIRTTPATGDEGGTLWTEATYEDFLLAVTFRATWPIQAGIWLRSEDSQPGPRIEISDSKPALTGSVWVPAPIGLGAPANGPGTPPTNSGDGPRGRQPIGAGLALANLREDLLDREGWNTISARIEGNRIQVWLNGEEIGAVRTVGPPRGRIGLYVAKSPTAKPGELSVREVLIQRLARPEEKVPPTSPDQAPKKL